VHLNVIASGERGLPVRVHVHVAVNVHVPVRAALLKARRSAARGSGPDQREGQGGDRQLPARDPESAREAAKPGDDTQHD